MRWQEPVALSFAVLCSLVAPRANAQRPFVALWGNVVDQGALPFTGGLANDGAVAVYDEPNRAPASLYWAEETLATPLDGSPTQYRGATGLACTATLGGNLGSSYFHLGSTSPTVATALVVTSDPMIRIAYGPDCLLQYEQSVPLFNVFPDAAGRGLEADDLVVFDSTRHVVAMRFTVNDATQVDGLRIFSDNPGADPVWIGFQCRDGSFENPNQARFNTTFDLLQIMVDDQIERYNVVAEVPGAGECRFGGEPCEKVLDSYFFCTRAVDLEVGERDETSLLCSGVGLRSGRAVAVTDGNLVEVTSMGATPACELNIPGTPVVDGGVGMGDAAVPVDAAAPVDGGSGRLDGGLADAGRPGVDGGSRSLDSGADPTASGIQFVGGGGCGVSASPDPRTLVLFGLACWFGRRVRRRRP